MSMNNNMEVIQSFPSLFKLEKFQEDAIINVTSGMNPVIRDNGIDASDDRWDDEYFCPICDEYLDYEQKHCKECGQKIKWE